ncbi:MAG: NAD(P)/FAD-dependent oxidoreductase [Candidatus Binatia bacterium]
MRRIVIIGSGFGGLGLAIRLKRAGIDSFTILEQSDSLGGTWRDNSYPGAACDVPSMLYCFSFEQKTDWTRKWSSQSEIRQYMEDCARRNGILPHIRFGVRVAGARFDEASGAWTVRTAAGAALVADVLVSGVGQLHVPHVPDIPGLDGFRGVQFHSARWRHDADLAGTRIGVIGNAASAIQFIPQIAPAAQRLTIFQRSANWMVPRGDRAYSAFEHWLYGNIPGLVQLYRLWLWLRGELFLYPVMRRRPWAVRTWTEQARKHLEETVRDPQLRQRLTPDYPIGGKRVLIADDFFPTLNRDNVEVVTSAVARVTETGVVTADGRAHELDVLILATGFKTNPFLASLRIEGLGGRTLEQDWAHGARAYYGITVAGYPNFFMLYGPNTNLGHNTIIYMLECQMAYIIGALRALEAEDLRYLDLQPVMLDAYNAEIQAVLRGSAWAAAGDSWYKDAEGHITNNWPWSTFAYWLRTRRFDRAAYRAARRVAGSAAAPRGDRQAA